MALFPGAKFEILVPGGALVAGRRSEGMLVVTAQENIPRATHVELVFRSIAQTSDRGNHKITEEIFRQQVIIQLPNYLSSGTHRFPFALDPPESLPPTFAGYPADLERYQAVFPSLVVTSNGMVMTLDRPVFSMNPRELWPAIEAIVTWVLDVRGERRTSMPYR